MIDVFIEENVPADEPQFGASKSKVQSCAMYHKIHGHTAEHCIKF